MLKLVKILTKSGSIFRFTALTQVGTQSHVKTDSVKKIFGTREPKSLRVMIVVVIV